MTLKTYLAKQTWGGKTLFRNVREAARYIREHTSAAYSSDETLASLIGQISSGAKPLPDRLRGNLFAAVSLVTEAWPELDKHQCIRDLDLHMNLLQLETSSRQDLAAAIYAQAIQAANKVMLILPAFPESGLALFDTELVGVIWDRFFKNDNFYLHVNDESTPSLAILVPKVRVPGLWQCAAAACQRREEGRPAALINERIGELHRAGKLNAVEVTPTVCTSGAVVLPTRESGFLGFHFYERDAATRLSVMDERTALAYVDEIYKRYSDPEDHDLRKRAIPLEELRLERKLISTVQRRQMVLQPPELTIFKVEDPYQLFGFDHDSDPDQS